MSAPDYFAFTLYVKDRSQESSKVHERLAQLCFRYLPGRHILKVEDLSQLGDKGDKYRLASTPGTLGALPPQLSNFLEDIAFNEDFYLFVERAD
jgi:hypothetical protein